MKPRVGSRLFLLLLFGASAVGCGSRADVARTSLDPVVSVRVAPLQRRLFQDIVQASGVWKSQGELAITAPFGGVVEAMAAHVGDEVRAGDLLGSLITSESLAALRGAEAMARAAADSTSRDEAERALSLAKRDLVRLPLRAPRGGVIVRRSAEPGARVAEGSELLAIVDWSTVVFEAHVPQDRGGLVREGLRAEIHEEGRPACAAVVERVLPSADLADQATLVWLRPQREDPRPLLGRFGAAIIALGREREAVAVPDSAVVEDDLSGDLRVALVDSSGRVRWKSVLLGAPSEGWRELRAPSLGAGTNVIVANQRALAESVRVTWTP